MDQYFKTSTTIQPPTTTDPPVEFTMTGTNVLSLTVIGTGVLLFWLIFCLICRSRRKSGHNEGFVIASQDVTGCEQGLNETRRNQRSETGFVHAPPGQRQDVTVHHDNHTQTNSKSILAHTEQRTAYGPVRVHSETNLERKLGEIKQTNAFQPVRVRSDKSNTVPEGTGNRNNKKRNKNTNTEQNRGRTNFNSPAETLPTISGSVIGSTAYIRSTDLLSQTVSDTQAPKRHMSRITKDPDKDTRELSLRPLDDRKPPPPYEDLQRVCAIYGTAGSFVTERSELNHDNVNLPEVLDFSSDAIAHFPSQQSEDDKKSNLSCREMQIASVSNEISDEWVPSDCDYFPEPTSFISDFPDLPELGMMRLEPVTMECED